VIVVVEIITTLMMQQMHAYMLPGAAKSLGKHLPKLLFFAEQDWIFVIHSLSLFSRQVWKILTLNGVEFVSGEITLERLCSLIASISNEDAQ
jgi:hypothetical protein